MDPRQRSLLEAGGEPPGFAYAPSFLGDQEESALLAQVEGLAFEEVRMHGVVARRRVVHFGWDYGYDSWTIRPTAALPEWLRPPRDRAADLAGLRAEDLVAALVARYPPGAGIGWHRDAPMFGPTVVGLSLRGAGVIRFRRGPGVPRAEIVRVPLAPRSAYVLSGPARSAWQHSLPGVKELRYSITFRSLAATREPRGSGPEVATTARGRRRPRP